MVPRETALKRPRTPQRGSLRRAPPGARGRRSARAPSLPSGPASGPASDPASSPASDPLAPPSLPGDGRSRLPARLSRRRRSRLSLPGSHRCAPGRGGAERRRSAAAVLRVSGAGKGTRSLAALRASAAERGRWPRRVRQVSAAAAAAARTGREAPAVRAPPPFGATLARPAGPERGRSRCRRRRGGHGCRPPTAEPREPGGRRRRRRLRRYSLTPRAERSPALTWLPGCGLGHGVGEVARPRRARLAGDVLGGVAGPRAGARPRSARPDFGRGSGRTPAPRPRAPLRGPLAPPPAEKQPGGRGKGWSRVDAAARQELPVVGD